MQQNQRYCLFFQQTYFLSLVKPGAYIAAPQQLDYNLDV